MPITDDDRKSTNWYVHRVIEMWFESLNPSWMHTEHLLTSSQLKYFQEWLVENTSAGHGTIVVTKTDYKDEVIVGLNPDAEEI